MSAELHFKELRDIVRKLDATGDEGFEGLMAVVLTEVTKTTFSLAKSGAQHGRDGQSTLDLGAIAFEGKRYDETVPKNEVLSKIAEIAANDKGRTDLWILGATAPVRTQDIETINDLGELVGIGTLIVDWPTTGLPPLATLLAMAPERTAAFLSLRTGASESDILAKLDAVRRDDQFAERVQELNVAIQQPSVGPAYALKNNGKFLKAAFGNTKKAKAIFGQPLAPGDTSVPSVLDRLALRENLAKLMFGKPSGFVTVVLGADGNGKSWLFGQSWLHQTIKPLTIVLVPDDIKEPVTPASVEEHLITGLINQTEDVASEVVRGRWQKHFSRWKRIATPNIPRLIVFVDGLNQRPSVQWARVVDAFGHVLEQMGGNLVLSCRTPFFRNDLKDRLVYPVRSIEVPEWMNPELEKLLNEHKTSINKLKPRVVELLRNPRIFAIAVDLLLRGKIESFTELSVSRLLFEHVRAGASFTVEPLSVGEFVRGVRDHADEIVKRLTGAGRTDLQIFSRPAGLNQANSSLRDQLAVISAGQFFEEVPGDPTLYGLRDDSLPLALGLSLLSIAQRAHRNKLDIPGELSKILDPIAALDNTAEVLISALIVAVLGENTTSEVIAALATAFVSLQNLDATRFSEFQALVRQDVTPFLQALESATLSEGVTSNLSWLTEALLACRDIPECWSAIVTFIERWLSMYSLALERMMFGQRSSNNEERAKEYQKRRERLDEKLAALNVIERELLSSLAREERGNYTKLNRTAFQFVAGRPLAPFGMALRNWCFAACLNGGYDDGHDEFNHLVQFNRLDWQQARIAMLASAEVLRSPEVSAVGRWALVYALRATGHPADAKQATEIWEELIKNSERHPGRRLVESWCATDPCDPASERPENIEETARKYAALNIAQLKNTRERGQEDYFFDEAVVGLARFEPDVAIAEIRRFAADVVTRDQANFWIAASALEDHTAALDNGIASLFVPKAYELANDTISQIDEHKELFVASQYSLMIAFPHMSGDEQLEALMAYPKVDNLLLSLCECMQDADPLKFEVALEKTYAEGDVVNQFRLLAFGQTTETKMTNRAKAIVGKLVVSESALVRLCALGVVHRLDEPDLLKIVVDSNWSANALEAESSRVEIWYGSEVLALAAGRKLISVNECVARMGADAYLSLVRRVGREAVSVVASEIDMALRRAVGHRISMALPDIERPLGDGRRPTLYNVEERPEPNDGVQSTFGQLADAGDAWYERQRRVRETVEKFGRQLAIAGAQIIGQAVTSDLIEEIYKEAPVVVRKWYKYFMALNEQELRQVYNIALPVGQIIAAEDQAGAVALFEKLALTDPVVRITVGKARISLDRVAVWRAVDGNELLKLRFERLDRAGNDHELASEVLAALNAGKVDIIRDYVLDRHARPEPSHVARAVMVSGLCRDAPWALDIISAHKDDHGFLADSYKAAKYAVERFQWSEHWARMMGGATSERELWRYGVLLAKVVDGRTRREDLEGSRNLIRRYGPSFKASIRRRMEKWKDKRSKTLFGGKLPDTMFLA